MKYLEYKDLNLDLNIRVGIAKKRIFYLEEKYLLKKINKREFKEELTQIIKLFLDFEEIKKFLFLIEFYSL